MAVRKRRKNDDGEKHVCRDCRHVVYVMEQWTLSHSGAPTFGKCPYYSKRWSVLLSQACCEHFEKKT